MNEANWCGGIGILGAEDQIKYSWLSTLLNTNPKTNKKILHCIIFTWLQLCQCHPNTIQCTSILQTEGRMPMPVIMPGGTRTTTVRSNKNYTLSTTMFSNYRLALLIHSVETNVDLHWELESQYRFYQHYIIADKGEVVKTSMEDLVLKWFHI